jgi:hypothetical protein
MNTYRKTRGVGVLLLTGHAVKGVCPERPTGVKDLSCDPMRMRILPAPSEVEGSERSESKDLSSHPTGESVLLALSDFSEGRSIVDEQRSRPCRKGSLCLHQAQRIHIHQHCRLRNLFRVAIAHRPAQQFRQHRPLRRFQQELKPVLFLQARQRRRRGT